MRITAEYLHEKWKSIDYYDGGFIQAAAVHAMEWHIGWRNIDQKTLVFLSPCEPELLPSSKSIAVSKGLRSDKRWTLSFSLLRIEQDGVFEQFCADLISYSQHAGSETDVLKLVAKRFKQWNKLLAQQRKCLMDENNRKGLLGELIYLSEVIKKGRSVLSALEGWVGPDGADQDFVYSDGWHEIKAVGVNASFVKISSREQLDCSIPGELVVMKIDKCAPERRGGISLSEQVDAVTALVQDDENACMLLERKLLLYGFIDLPEYRKQKYFYSGQIKYRVDETFPRLTSEMMPPQIAGVQYVLSLAGIEEWRMEE